MNNKTKATIGGIPLKELEKAMSKDFTQHQINSMTPDRGYAFPTDHVRALISKYSTIRQVK